jgi:hypothetical protein
VRAGVTAPGSSPDSSKGAPSTTALGWAEALRAVETALADPALAGSGPRANVRISAAFVRYALIPRSEVALSAEQRRDIIDAMFNERHGERSGGIVVSLETERFGRHRLGVAIDRGFIEGLRELLARRGARLVALQPEPSQRIDRLRRRLQGKAGWFVLADDGVLLAFAFVDGGWVGAHRESLPGGDAAAIAAAATGALERILRRETIRLPALLGGSVFVGGGLGPCAAVGRQWPVVHFDAVAA